MRGPRRPMTGLMSESPELFLLDSLSLSLERDLLLRSLSSLREDLEDPLSLDLEGDLDFPRFVSLSRLESLRSRLFFLTISLTSFESTSFWFFSSFSITSKVFLSCFPFFDNIWAICCMTVTINFCLSSSSLESESEVESLLLLRLFLFSSSLSSSESRPRFFPFLESEDLFGEDFLGEDFFLSSSLLLSLLSSFLLLLSLIGDDVSVEVFDLSACACSSSSSERISPSSASLWSLSLGLSWSVDASSSSCFPSIKSAAFSSSSGSWVEFSGMTAITSELISLFERQCFVFPKIDWLSGLNDCPNECFSCKKSSLQIVFQDFCRLLLHLLVCREMARQVRQECRVT